MIMLLKRYLILFAAALLTACGEDEFVYPNAITEFMCLDTNHAGQGTHLTTDRGTTWELAEGYIPTKLTPDSTYRVLCLYEILEDRKIKAYDIKSAVASLPRSAEEFSVIKTDPVSIQSIWRSGNYLNLILQVMMKDQPHTFSFIEKGITRNNDGTQNLSLTLYHDQNNDIEAFYRKCYLSVPLWYFQDRLKEGDQIIFQLNTYEEGMTSRTFTY